ncbi:DUF190 domain-containing protein [Aquifex sp.]
MRLEKQVLLRIFTDEDAKREGKPLYKFILERAKELGLSGATVFRGIAGFGRSGRLREPSLLSLRSHLPIVVEIIDSEGKIKALLESLKNECDCVYTLEEVEVVVYE